MIDAEHEISLAVGGAFAVLAAGLAGGELISAEGMFGAEIARADAISAAENARRLLRASMPAMRRRISCASLRLAERDADVAGQRIVAGDAFVGAFEDDDVLFAAQRVDDRRFGERTNHVDVNRADLGIALFAQIIARGFDVVRRATERDENRVRIVALILR